MRNKLLKRVTEIEKKLGGFIKKHHNIIIIMLVALFARLSIATESLSRDFWHDEAFQYLFSLKPVSFILVGNDVHPPLFSLFTKLLVSIFGNDIFMLRWVGATAFSIAAIFVFYYFIKDIFNENIALYSTLFFSVTPSVLYFSFEFRNYMFTMFFLMLQMWAFSTLMDEDIIYNKYINKTSIAYILLSTVVLYSHYLAVLIILAQTVYVFYLRCRKQTDSFTLNLHIISLLITGVLCIPLLIYTMLVLSKSTAFWFANIGLVSLVSAFAYIITPPLTVLTGIVLFIYGVIIYAMIRYRKYLTNKHLLFTLYIIVPILSMWLVSVFLMPFFHPRYFMWGGWVGLCVLVAWSLVRMEKRDKEITSCFFAFYCVLVIITFNQGINRGAFIDAFNYDITESVDALYNYTKDIVGCQQDCIIIHNSQGTQTPYRVYFPTAQQVLISTLTRKQQFTLGGSVIDYDTGYYPSIAAVPKKRYMFYVTEKPIRDALTIYAGDGLYVQQIS